MLGKVTFKQSPSRKQWRICTLFSVAGGLLSAGNGFATPQKQKKAGKTHGKRLSFSFTVLIGLFHDLSMAPNLPHLDLQKGAASCHGPN